VFVEITVEHIVTGYHIQPEAVARAIQLLSNFSIRGNRERHEKG
jgi:hypothetical protein